MSSEFKAVIVNEATGEIEYLTQDILLENVVDTSLGSVSHEVEVVTVDDFRRRIRNSTSTTQSIVKPVVTPLLSPSGSSAAASTPTGSVVTQQPSVLRNTPTLLRNSRTSSARSVAQTTVQIQQQQQQQSQQQQQQQIVTQTVTSNEIIFVSSPHQFQIENATGGGVSAPSVLPPASAQFIRTVEDGSADGTQLIVYDCADNQFDLIGNDNVQLRLCQVLQDDSEEGGQSTIYICEQDDGGVSFAQEDEEYSGIQVVEELPILQDEHGNVYEVEQFQPNQIELELPIAGPARKRKKLGENAAAGGGGGAETSRRKFDPKDLVMPIRMSKRPLCDLKCMEPECTYAAMNIGELRKHLTAAHGLAFDEETILFPSDKDFKHWRETYERERMVSFIFRGGTKKISREQAVTYLICHRSGHYKPTMKDQSMRKRKMKPQGSCKMNGYCTAGIKLLKNLESGEVKCEICHTHYGHPLDNGAIPHLRVNNVLRKIIWKKFEEGMNFNQVVQYLHHNPDHLEGLRLLDRRAVRNIYDKFRKNPDKKYSDDDFDMEEASPSQPESHEDDPSTPTSTPDQMFEKVPLVKSEVASHELTSLSEENTAEETAEATGEKQDEEAISNVADEAPRSPETIVPDIQPPVIRARRRGRPAGAAAKTPPSAPKEKEPEPEPVAIRRSARERKPKVFPDEDKLVQKGVRIKTEVVEKPAEEAQQRRLSEEKEPGPPILEKVKPVESVPADQQEPPVLSVDEKSKEEHEKAEDKKADEVITSLGKDSTPKASDRQERLARRKSTSEASSTSDTEDVITEELKQTIQNLLQHGESGPTVLMYKKPGSVTPEYGRKDPRMHKDDFMLIIQTPVQRQLMQMFSDVVNVDCHKGRPKDMKLMWVLVLDEFREAIPVAWLITNSTDDRVVSIFLRTLHQHTGDMPTQYVMAPFGSDYAHLWSSIFKCSAQLILNEEDTKRDMRIEVAENFSDNNSRRVLNGLMSDMMTAFDEEVFKKVYDEFEKFLVTEHGEKGKQFLKLFDSNWLSRRSEWDLVHRIGAPVNTLHASDAFGKLKKFIAFKGTKILNSCIEPILKIGYDKCFSRSKRIFKGDQKILKIMEDIEMQHSWGAEMDSSCFSAEGSIYYVKLGDGKTVRKVFPVKSPCRCKFICPKCQVCVHQYVCDCNVSSVDHIMCSHIHFVHLMTNQPALPTPASVAGAEEATTTTTTTSVPVILTVVEEVSEVPE